MISTYRMAMLQVLDLVCILLALSITGFLTVEYGRYALYHFLLHALFLHP